MTVWVMDSATEKPVAEFADYKSARDYCLKAPRSANYYIDRYYGEEGMNKQELENTVKSYAENCDFWQREANRFRKVLGEIRVELCAHQEPSAAVQNAYQIAVAAIEVAGAENDDVELVLEGDGLAELNRAIAKKDAQSNG